MVELEAQLSNLSISNDEPSLLDASDAQEIMQCAAKAKDEVLVIVLVGLCGAGKSATANRLSGNVEKRRAQRSAGPVTKSCGVACGDSLVVLDTPGFGDAGLGTNATAAAIRKATQEAEDAVAATGKEARFSVLYVASCASRLNTADLEAMVAVGFALGRAWRNSALLVWTHADLLEEASLQEFLEGLDGDARVAADSLRGGHCLLDNVSTGGAATALVEDVLDRCRRFSRIGRPQPSGKHARRIRQDAMRRREARRRAENGEAPPSLCRVS